MEVLIAKKPVPYLEALATMEQRVDDIIAGRADELLWLLEHPHVYTAGTSAQAQDLINPGDIPVIETGRGGQYTYHGPGQRVAYVMVDLKTRGRQDVRWYIHQLEEWIIQTLATFDIAGVRRDGRVGIWVAETTGTEAKIAAIGVRLKKWVTSHGIALNVAPDLSKYAGIIPCGVRGHGVTSITDFKKENVAPSRVDHTLVAKCPFAPAQPD